MKPIGHDDPTHLAERIECRAYNVGGCAGAMNPEGTARESHDGCSRSHANTAEPDRTFGDPDGVGHDDFENAGRCHERSLPSFGVLPLASLGGDSSAIRGSNVMTSWPAFPCARRIVAREGPGERLTWADLVWPSGIRRSGSSLGASIPYEPAKSPACAPVNSRTGRTVGWWVASPILRATAPTSIDPSRASPAHAYRY